MNAKYSAFALLVLVLAFALAAFDGSQKPVGDMGALGQGLRIVVLTVVGGAAAAVLAGIGVKRNENRFLSFFALIAGIVFAVPHLGVWRLAYRTGRLFSQGYLS